MRRLANVIRGRQAVALSPVTLELHGLARYADYPRSVDRDGNVRRLPQAIALRRPDVDLADAITVWAALTLKAPETRYKAADGLPLPNWTVITDGGQAYPTWCLFLPVAKHENARAGQPNTWQRRSLALAGVDHEPTPVGCRRMARERDQKAARPCCGRDAPRTMRPVRSGFWRANTGARKRTADITVSA